LCIGPCKNVDNGIEERKKNCKGRRRRSRYGKRKTRGVRRGRSGRRRR
jgi:hypothetical protein